MKLKKLLPYSLMVTCLFSNAMAMEDKAYYSTFQEYNKSRRDQNLPLTLMVGCGHGHHYTWGNHTHPDCWSVNLEAGDEGRFSQYLEETFKEKVQYDEVLDISMSYFPNFNRVKELLPIRKADYKNKVAQLINSYINSFDIVVLERPLPITLNKPWTLWNAVHMLKVGGELIIDSIDGYDSHLYEKDSNFRKEVCPQGNLEYPVNLNLEKLEKFGISEIKTAHVYQEMIGISNYLAFWGLTDIINIGDRYNTKYHAYQPYTRTPGKSLETARRTCIFSATKTQETEDRMDDWSIAILKAEFPSIRRRAIPIANNLEVKTQNEKKEDVSKTVRDAPVEPYQNLAEAGIIPQKMSSKEIIGNLLIEEKRGKTKSQNLNIARENFSLESLATAAETKVILKEEKVTAAKEGSNSSEVGYKEVKFPSLALIKEQLDLGNSSIFSDTDCFNVQSIMGVFIGFNFPVLDLKMKCVGISSDYKDKGFYTISGILDVMFEGDKKTRILLKSSYRKEREYIIQGGMKTEKGNFYMVSDPADLKIMVPIKK